MVNPTEPIPVEGVELTQGLLTWKTTSDGSVDTAKQDNIIFIFASANPDKTQSAFVVCLLAEDTNNPTSPYIPSFLAANTLPDNLLNQHLVRTLPSHLQTSPQANNKVDVIVSVKSGTNLALAFWETVLRPLLSLSREFLRLPASTHDGAHAPGALQAEGGEPQVVVTQSKHSVREYAQALAAPGQVDASSSESRTIILLSGDGGVVDLLNGRGGSESDGMDSRKGTEPVIALMPLGTGNALFHSLHKPVAAAATDASPLVLALRTLFKGSPANLPTFRASFSPGAYITSFAGNPSNVESQDSSSSQMEQTPVDYLQGAIVASYGFHASIVYESDTPEYRLHGAKRFGMVAQDLLRESHPYRAHVDIRRASADPNAQLERIPRESHAYVLTTLVSNLERTFCISPDSQPLDGQMRLVHFAPVGGERTMAAMMAAYDGGKHVGMVWDEDGERVGYEQAEEVRVTVLEEEARWRKVCVDGTIVEIPQGGYMSVTKVAGDRSGFQVLVDPRVARS
ncbi:diacylglycerol kinase catalytic domain-containing protein [Sarocladium implicatum]|nr:diacylglycerol kinase catalytic domain-containing protein [Sarocladium implicatum]